MIEFLIIGLCAWLNYKGGVNFLAARRFMMPFFIALYCAWKTQWWVFPAMYFLLWGMISLPNDKRPLWCLGIASIGILPLLFVNLNLGFYSIYVLYCTILGFSVKWKYTDYLTGAGFSSIVLFV